MKSPGVGQEHPIIPLVRICTTPTLVEARCNQFFPRLIAKAADAAIARSVIRLFSLDFALGRSDIAISTISPGRGLIAAWQIGLSVAKSCPNIKSGTHSPDRGDERHAHAISPVPCFLASSCVPLARHGGRQPLPRTITRTWHMACSGAACGGQADRAGPILRPGPTGRCRAKATR